MSASTPMAPVKARVCATSRAATDGELLNDLVLAETLRIQNKARTQSISPEHKKSVTSKMTLLEKQQRQTRAMARQLRQRATCANADADGKDDPLVMLPRGDDGTELGTRELRHREAHTSLLMELGERVSKLHALRAKHASANATHHIKADHQLAVLETHLQLCYLFHQWQDGSGVLTLVQLLAGLHLTGWKVAHDQIHAALLDVVYEGNHTAMAQAALDDPMKAARATLTLAQFEGFMQHKAIGIYHDEDARKSYVAQLARDINARIEAGAVARHAERLEGEIMDRVRSRSSSSSPLAGLLEKEKAVSTRRHLETLGQATVKGGRDKKKRSSLYSYTRAHRREQIDAKVEMEMAEHHHGRAVAVCCVCAKYMGSGWRFAFLGIVLWLSTGTAVYAAQGWRGTNAFYYAVQAGLSIGFGALSEEKGNGGIGHRFDCAAEKPPANPTDLERRMYAVVCGPTRANDRSKAYTILHICAGASVIAGALGLFTSVMLERSESWHEEETHRAHSERKTNLVKDDDRISKTRTAVRRASLVVTNEAQTYCGAGACYCATKNRLLAKSALAVVMWILVGAVFGVLHERWSFLTGVYFAVAACSTAGLQAADVGAPDGKGDGASVFVALYCLVGVPLYGLVLGQVSGFFTESWQRKKLRDKINKNFSQAELEHATKLDIHTIKSRTGSKVKYQRSINRTTFLELEMLRAGLADQETLQQMLKHFDALDVNGDGELTMEEIQISATFDVFDTDGSNTIDESEFHALLDVLTLGLAAECDGRDNMADTNAIGEAKKLDTAFLAAAEEIQTMKFPLSKADFMGWWKKHKQLHLEKQMRPVFDVLFPLASHGNTSTEDY